MFYMIRRFACKFPFKPRDDSDDGDLGGGYRIDAWQCLLLQAKLSDSMYGRIVVVVVAARATAAALAALAKKLIPLS